MKPNRPRFHFGVEPLEDRCNPSTFGVPWANAEQLTLSFVPDGTPTPRGPSQLFQTLNAVAPTAVWQREILRAYQAWLVNSEIAIAVVPDGGQPLGTTGAVQGDSRFGDIRIAAYAMNSDETIATGAPFSWIGSTYSGELLFNAEQLFEIGSADDSAFDLYSVALHEAGHSLGLDHSTAPDSVMQEEYHDYTVPGASDIAKLNRLYGARPKDAYDAAGGGNNTPGTAAWIPPNGVSQLLATGDLTTNADIDYYKFTISAVDSLTPVVVRLKASGVSLLAARITVLDSAGNTVATAAVGNPQANDLALQFAPAALGGTYTVKVEKTSDAFSVGKYLLAVDRGLLSTVAPILVPVVTILDSGMNNQLANATTVPSRNPTGQDDRFDFYFEGAIENATDIDSYSVMLPPAAGATSPVNLYVLVWAGDAFTLKPRIRVFNAAQQLLPMQILLNEAGQMSVVVPNATPGAHYYIQVDAKTPGNGPGSTGRYILAADANTSTPPAAIGLAKGTLAAAATRSFTVQYTQAGLYQFALSANPVAFATTTLTAFDANNMVVFSLTIGSGQQTVTAIKGLAAGSYRFRITTTSTVPANYNVAFRQINEAVGTVKSATAGAVPIGPRPGSDASSAKSSFKLSGNGSGDDQYIF